MPGATTRRAHGGYHVNLPWLRLSGAPYAPLTLASILVGTVYASSAAFPFHGGAFLAAALAALFAHVGFSALLSASSADGDASHGEAVTLAAIGIALALACAIVLVPLTGATALGLAFLGLLLGALYASPPLPLRDLGGLGEAVAFLVFGPLLVSFGYYAQSAELSGGALVASLPLGLLATGTAFVEHFVHARRDADPLCPVLGLGEAQAKLFVWLLPALGYLAIALAVSQNEYPRVCLASIVTAAPLAWKLRGLDASAPPEAGRSVTRWSAVLAAATGVLIVLGYAL